MILHSSFIQINIKNLIRSYSNRRYWPTTALIINAIYDSIVEHRLLMNIDVSFDEGGMIIKLRGCDDRHCLFTGLF